MHTSNRKIQSRYLPCCQHLHWAFFFIFQGHRCVDVHQCTYALPLPSRRTLNKRKKNDLGFKTCSAGLALPETAPVSNGTLTKYTLSPTLSEKCNFVELYKIKLRQKHSFSTMLLQGQSLNDSNTPFHLEVLKRSASFFVVAMVMENQAWKRPELGLSVGRKPMTWPNPVL